MDDIFIVHILESRDDLLAEIGSLFLTEFDLGKMGCTLARKSLKRHWEQYSRMR
jgi:hypothetical protein